jgi:Sap, sulfolipid-1-addressing protein
VAELPLLAIASAFYPTLLAISVVLLSTPQPRPMLLGYAAGALIASIATGLAIVFVLADSGALDDSRPKVSPAVDLAAGALVLVLGWLVATGRVERVRERRRLARGDRQRPPWSKRVLSHGSVRVAFGAALVLSVVPGLFYLVALKDIADSDQGAAVEVLLVLAFNLVQFALIEVPLVAFAIAPERTGERVERLDAGLRRHGRRIGTVVCLVMGLYLVARGAAGLAG